MILLYGKQSQFKMKFCLAYLLFDISFFKVTSEFQFSESNDIICYVALKFVMINCFLF